MRVQFLDDAATFLTEASEFLASDPLNCSVIASVATNIARHGAQSNTPCWFAIVRDGDTITGAAMRTHPQPPHAGFAPTMPAAAVTALADGLAARGERVPAWNGDLTASRALCEAVADGAPVEVPIHQRMFELTEVRWPTQPKGELRQATPADVELINAWLHDFHVDSEIQGGRIPDPSDAPTMDNAVMNLDFDRIWFWTVDGHPVHLTGLQPAGFGIQRIGPVYTPAQLRGHGYAGWVVALLSQRLLDAGLRPCLYTDQANPVSNKVYERIGYRRVRDEGQVVIRSAASEPTRVRPDDRNTP